MKRKLLSVFLSLAMVLTMMPMFAMADSGTVGGGTTSGEESDSAEVVAKIGEQSYKTLESAISEAKDRETIKLLADVSIGSEIDFTGKTITLDLNGKKIDGKVPSSYSVIKAKGESASLTIKDTSSEANGKLISNNYGISATDGGKLIIESGTIESNYAAMAGNNTAGDMNFEVNGGTLTSKSSEAIYMPGQVQLTVNAGEINGGISARMGQITVNGGTINGMTSDQAADSMEEYFNYSGSAWIGDAIYIWGGTYTSENSLGNKTNLKINGGQINGNAHRAISIYDIGTKYDQAITVEISGDTVVSGDVVIDKTYGSHSHKVDASIEIKGGTFSSDVGSYCAEGYATEKNGNNTYTVKHLKDVAVAQIGENSFYRTINEAVDASNNSDTITLLKDTVEDVTVPSGKNITLDLNGKKLTNVSNNTITIEKDAELTVTGNGTVDNLTHAKSAIYNKGTATLENGTFDRSAEAGENAKDNGGNSYYTVLNHGTMTVEPGVTVNNKGSYSSLFENGYFNYKNEKDGIEYPILTINGGTFTGGLNTIKNDDNATLTIKDGTFENYTQAAFQNHHIATIEGGTFNGANVDAVLNCGVCSSVDAGHDDHETTITGGSFKGNISKTVGKITISGGLFSKEFDKSYCETGLTVIDNTDEATKESYPKTVGTIKVNDSGEIKEASELGTNVTKVGTDISGEENIKAAEAIANSVEVPSEEGIKDNVTITNDDKDRAVTALVEGNKLSLVDGKIPEGTTVTVVKEIYLEVELTELNMNNGTENPTVTMNITPKYNLIAKVESGENTESIPIKSALDATVTAQTKVSVKLPKDTFTKDKKVYINHDNGKNIYVTKVKDDEGTVEFTTNGFSPFTFALSNPNVIAEVNGNAYTSLQAAVDAAASGSTIEIVGGDTSKEYTATMTGSSKTITVKNSTSNKIAVKVNGESKDIEKGKTADFTYTRHSSSGSSTTTYTVTVGSVSNGTVTSSHKSAASGTTVTLTVKPADGYAVEAVTAKDAKGNAVKVTEKDGKYTFAMPASNVTVSASFKKSEQQAAKLFDDVAQGAYYYDAVKWAVDKGVTNGKTSNLFGSDDPCTRAQIVTFLYRAAGSPAGSAAVSFTDVKDSDYYAKAVAWAVEKGITNGTGNGKFSPDDTCTRAQCAAFLYRAAGSPEVTDAAAFSDVAADAYYAKAVAWAEKNGITNGLGNGKFGSDNSCTRAQIITFLYRTYQGK